MRLNFLGYYAVDVYEFLWKQYMYLQVVSSLHVPQGRLGMVVPNARWVVRRSS